MSVQNLKAPHLQATTTKKVTFTKDTKEIMIQRKY